MPFLRVTLALAAAASVVFLSGCSHSDSASAAQVRVYEMGQKAEAGRLIYTVFETQWLPQIGTGVSARVPQNRYFLVRLSAVNSGNNDVSVPNLTIEDDGGNSYNELSNGEGVPQWIGLFRQVKPADSASGTVIFDAPPKHYRMRVTDENGEHAALIDIPLKF